MILLLILQTAGSGLVSSFCLPVCRPDVNLIISGGYLDWRTMQTLVRSMPDLHKTLILVNVRRKMEVVEEQGRERNNNNTEDDDDNYDIDEIAIATEHAPFRHRKKVPVGVVGSQRKKKKKKPRVMMEE